MNARRVAVVYDPDSIPVLSLVAATTRSGVELVWITDDEDEPVLRRFGEVAPLAGRPVDVAAAQLAKLNVCGITTFADTRIEQTAALTAALGLPGNPPETARRLVDKIAQRTALRAADVPVPRFVGVQSPYLSAQVRDELNRLCYPVVLKPAVGHGGRDTLCLSNPAAVTAELHQLHDAGRWRPAIVEECLGAYPPQDRQGLGDYVSVELAVDAGVPVAVAVTGRMPLAEPFRETGAFLPCALDPAEQRDVAAMAVAAARALGVRCGCLHTEIKLTREGPRVIEVNGRVAGGGIADLVAAVKGVDMYECAVRSAMGEPLRLPPTATTGMVHYHFALQPPIGRRVRLPADWSARLQQIAGLGRVSLRAEEAEVGERDGSYGYLLMAAGTAADHAALLDTYQRLYGLLGSE